MITVGLWGELNRIIFVFLVIFDSSSLKSKIKFLELFVVLNDESYFKGTPTNSPSIK